MNPNYRRFLLAVNTAYDIAQKYGTQWIYGYCDNTIFVPLHRVDPGWLFKLYPGGRKILSPEGATLFESWGVDVDEVTRSEKI